ncbi:3-hydroxyacyl-CoA dehydrogenase NAD-binding domain-containing protein [Elongatibacter sediminis]|uniref:3-hydroxyacyl-CoA dehydrogenase NAD-binding domain-containing protein n=1 Tax=Elongatibacter sediminis TaxID=3119006 RepID=A0AAW9RF23_9GAMM
MSQTEFTHWRIEHDLDGIRWATLDRAGESANSLSRDVLSELDTLVRDAARDGPRGLVFQSGKPGSFIVGADVREFEDVTDPEEAAASIREIHALFDRIEALPFPVVVAIDGVCLGGGLELALACHYRIAHNTDRTRLGFPEVKLGIYPGFGGSARSTRLLGGPKALETMLSARMLRAPQARAIGLVDKLVGPHGELRWAARNAILKNRRNSGPGWLQRLSNTAPARKAMAGMIRRKTAERANPDHYPAPFALIDAWEEFGGSKADMLEAEARRVGELITSDTSAGLRRVFWLMERLKEEGKKSSFRARRVHVVGAGVMGGDIAAWCVLQGLEVTLQDREMKYIEPAIERAGKLFKRKLRTPPRIAAARSRLIADVEGRGVARADVVIEAIFENADAKRELYRSLEPEMAADAILATNTSAIPLGELASVLQRPERLVGLHFFNPVAKMPLVEVVHDAATDPGEIERAAAFCNQISRFPLPVRSSPGFLVNRVLAPYMQKALQIHRERGVPKEALDRAATDFGMPMGPVELADTVGLDVGVSVMQMLGGEAAAEDIAAIRELVEAGKLGKKSGEGFYVWKDGKPVKDDDAVDGINLKTLSRELMQPYFDECRACLADGIVADAAVLDAGMVFGTGFAPFRGGPLHYLERSGGSEPDPVPDIKDGADRQQPDGTHEPARENGETKNEEHKNDD